MRIHALLCLLIDTGVRVSEALSLRREKIDFDNLILTVRGKGDKERLVPMSLELRTFLWKLSRQHKHDLLFPSRDGTDFSMIILEGVLEDFVID